MGGTSPDIGRNTSALQNAISFLIETRGVGIGREGYARRVHTHHVAIAACSNITADNASQVMNVVRGARSAVAQRGDNERERYCGDVEKPGVAQKLAMRDRKPASFAGRRRMGRFARGAARTRAQAPVCLRDAAVVRRRRAAAGLLRRRGEPAAPSADDRGRNLSSDRQARRNTLYEGHIRNTVTTEVLRKPLLWPPAATSIRMSQPDANIVAAALEPESPSSFVTFGIIPVDRKGAAAHRARCRSTGHAACRARCAQ